MAAGSGSGMDYSTGSRSGSEFMVGFGLESLAGSHSDSGSVVAGVTSGVGALSGGIGPGMRGMVMKVVEYKGSQPATSHTQCTGESTNWSSLYGLQEVVIEPTPTTCTYSRGLMT